MHPPFFEALVEELTNIRWLDDLPEWIPCTDSDILRDLPTTAEKRKWFRRAKAEITRQKIQDRVDEIAEAWENEDEVGIRVLTTSLPGGLEVTQDAHAPSTADVDRQGRACGVRPNQ